MVSILLSGDYQPWENRGREPGYQSHEQWKPPVDRFEDQTTNKRDYKPHETSPRRNYKPYEAPKRSDTPFQDRTIHRDDYVAHEIPPKYVRQKDTYKPGSAPAERETTFKRDYKGVQGTPMQSCKPKNEAYSSNAPLEDESTHRHDYKGWPTERPHKHIHEQYHKPEGDMEKNTTHRTAYKEHPLVKTIARKPESANRVKDSQPFDGLTNYAQDYQRKYGERAHVPKQTEYKPSSAPFAGNSTYKKHYVPHAVSPIHSYRPDNKPYQSDARLDDSTVYKHDYTQKEIQICDAALIVQGKSNYHYEGLDSRGHKLYMPPPTYTTITPLGTYGRRPSQRLAMSYA